MHAVNANDGDNLYQTRLESEIWLAVAIVRAPKQMGPSSDIDMVAVSGLLAFRPLSHVTQHKEVYWRSSDHSKTI